MEASHMEAGEFSHLFWCVVVMLVGSEYQKRRCLLGEVLPL